MVIKMKHNSDIKNEIPMTKENKMGSAPMLKLILSMALPAMFSMLVQSLYNIVDSIFVAQLGQKAFTAVTLAFPMQMMIVSVGVGTAVGINSLVSRRLGEGKVDQASSAATHGVFLAIITGIVFALAGIFLTKPFISAFTNDPEVIKMGCQYLYIVMILSFGVFLQINIEKTLQATGNMIYPMLFQLSGAITNIILDPILIFGLFGFPKLGIAGAAIATVIGQMVAMVFSMIIVHTKSHDVHIKLKGFKFHGETVKDIYAVGVPAIIMQSLGSVMTTAINGILTGFSASAVNVFGAYFKLQSFVFMPVFGLTQGIMPIMGFNYGARNRKRLVDTLKYGIIIAVIIMVLGTILFLAIPEKLLLIFNADAEMLRIGTIALRLISLCFIPAAIGIVTSTMFQAIGIGTKSLLISILRQMVILLPIAFIMSKISIDFVWLAFPIAEYSALVIAMVLLVLVFKKNINVVMPKSE